MLSRSGPTSSRCGPIHRRAKAGLKPGDVINAIAVHPAGQAEAPANAAVRLARQLFDWNKAERPKTIEFKRQSPSWFDRLHVPSEPAHCERSSWSSTTRPSPIKITPEPDPSWYNPTRGLQFYPQIRKLPAAGPPAAAMRSGYDETIQNILMVYATFRSLAERRVSPKNLGGPIMIAQVAYSAAGSGFTDLIYFLGILSINLAVLNFLPIPPLDGGQMLFLIAEKVRGRPLPDSAVIAGTYFGLILVLCLMVFVTYQDVFRCLFLRPALTSRGSRGRSMGAASGSTGAATTAKPACARMEPRCPRLSAASRRAISPVKLIATRRLTAADLIAALAQTRWAMTTRWARRWSRRKPPMPGSPAARCPSPPGSRCFPGTPHRPRLALAAGLLQIHDFWDASHDAAQRADDQGEREFSAYWHGIAHRREPDAGNAAYWFRRVGRHRDLQAARRGGSARCSTSMATPSSPAA